MTFNRCSKQLAPPATHFHSLCFPFFWLCVRFSKRRTSTQKRETSRLGRQALPRTDTNQHIHTRTRADERVNRLGAGGVCVRTVQSADAARLSVCVGVCAYACPVVAVLSVWVRTYADLRRGTVIRDTPTHAAVRRRLFFFDTRWPSAQEQEPWSRGGQRGKRRR